MALAEVSKKYRLKDIAPDLNTFGGAGLGAATARADAFLMALKNYDDALKEYHGYKNFRAAPMTLKKSYAKIEATFKALQIKFNRETMKYLDRYPAQMEMLDIVRPNNSIIQASRTIPLLSSTGASSLAQFAKFGRTLGPGVILLDGYYRYESVNNIRLAGGNWQQEAWAQGTGMLTGLGLGALGFGILFGPFGIVAAIIIAGISAVLVDKAVVSGVRTAYGEIIH